MTNVLTLGMGLILGFFLPKYVSIETYSDYKTYMLYADYLGLFHFGFINGLYLVYGKYDYAALPKDRFARYTQFLIVLEIVVQVILLLVYGVVRGWDGLLSPILFVILNILFVNLNCFFMLIDQFTKRFLIDALIQLLQSLLTIVGMTVLLVCKVDHYAPYLIALSVGNAIVFLVHCFNSRALLYCPNSHYRLTFAEVRSFTSRGIFVLMSEYMALIILGIDSMVVNLFMTTRDFSMYAFAVSVITVYYSLIAVISKFIFPYLKRMATDSYPKVYEDMKGLLAVFSALICGMTLVIVMLIPIVLPKYQDSVAIIKILGITAVFKGAQMLLCDNFFKVLDLEKGFFKTNLIAFVLGIVTDTIAVTIFHSLEAIAAASLLSFVLWYLISDRILRRHMQIKNIRNEILIFGIVVLYFLSLQCRPILGIILYYGVIGAVGVKLALSVRKKWRSENST